jgi:Holliday junction resolvase
MTKTKVKSKVLNRKITENDVKRVVKDYLSAKGFFHFHILQGLGSYKGIPDMVAIKKGRVLFLEIKKPTGKQSEHQKEFQQNIEYQGGEYILVRCLEDLIERGV